VKHCKKCNTTKHKIDFNKNRTNSDGLQAHCRLCQKKADSASYKKSAIRRAKVAEQGRLAKERGKSLVQRYKRMCKCRVCREDEPIALDLHHLDPSTKEDNPSRLYGYSFKKLKEEVRKCIVLCANCHRKVHAGLIEI
jgi:hypothetical protein